MMLYLTDYNEAERAALQDSFKTQFRDLRLKDFTDAFGVLKFKSLLPSPLMVANPYIFKMTKADASFMTLGTYHDLPLSVYPQNLIDLLLSCKNIVVESTNHPESIALYPRTPAAPLALQEYVEDSAVEELVVLPVTLSEFTQDWFEDLPIRQQQFVDYALGNPSSRHALANYAFLPFDKVAANLLFAIVYGGKEPVCGMDPELLLNPAFEQKYHLENVEELNITYSDNLSPAELMSMLEDDNIPTADLIKYHLSGAQGKTPLEDFIALTSGDKSTMQERNLKWVERLKVESHDEILVAVGVAHLFDNNGLLQLWEKDGWSIERVDLAGEFHAVELTADGLIV